VDDERLISLTEAAALCGLTRTQLAWLARKGRLQATRVGKSWVTTPQAVADYMNNPDLRSKDPHKYKRS
jgi:excisionase family DNA binding protein